MKKTIAQRVTGYWNRVKEFHSLPFLKPMDFQSIVCLVSVDISGWNVSSVLNMTCMFENSRFNGDLSAWAVSKVKSTFQMFKGSPFNGDLSGWDVSSVCFMGEMFAESDFKGDISGWNLTNVEDCKDPLSKGKE